MYALAIETRYWLSLSVVVKMMERYVGLDGHRLSWAKRTQNAEQV